LREIMFQEKVKALQSDLASRLMPWTLLSEEDKKPPKGFEKFFKKREERSASSKDQEGNICFSNINQVFRFKQRKAITLFVD
jgi:hypothetical protein